MKEEPFPTLNGDDVGGGGSYNGWEATFMEESSQLPAGDEDMDIKHEFPVVATNPLLELELEMEQGPTSQTGSTEAGLGLNITANYPNPALYLNENDDDDYGVDGGDYDDPAESELGVINGIINGGEVDVQDGKPVAIPIPMSMPAGLVSSNEIIINYTKPKPEGQRAQPKPCICTICRTGFPNQQLFQLHMSEVHADKRPFRCSHCGKGFAKASELDKHETIHDPHRFKGEPKFACDLCDNKYHIKGSLEGHRRIQHLGYKPPRLRKIVTVHHSIGVRNQQQPKKVAQVFKCPYCDLKFGMRCLVRKHMSCHTKDRPYQCSECGQRCASQGSLRKHTRTRHLNPSANPRPSRPKYMSNQPCPCTVCEKVFKTPSQLQKHFLVHSGEKPHECPTCGQRFGLRQGLRKHQRRLHETPKGQVNDNEAYKCLICGRGGFLLYSDLRNHRIGAHRHIPMPENSDKERPFGCGICGKPYNTKGQAMVCAVLKHDPKSLLAAMFKYKCSGCPDERFGYHSTYALRKHWEKEHVDKPLPVQYRVSSGMYTIDLAGNRRDALPTVTVNKELAKRINEYGPEPEVKYEFPLYIEFDLLPVDTVFYKEVIKGRKRKSGLRKPPETNFTCNICGAMIVHKRNFKKHIENHDRVGGGSNSKYSCDVCEKRFRELKNLQLHQRRHRYVLEGGGYNSHYNCPVCGKRFGKMKTLHQHQRQHKTCKADTDVATRRGPGRPPKRHAYDGQMSLIKVETKAIDSKQQLAGEPFRSLDDINQTDRYPDGTNTPAATKRPRGRPRKLPSSTLKVEAEVKQVVLTQRSRTQVASTVLSHSSSSTAESLGRKNNNNDKGHETNNLTFNNEGGTKQLPTCQNENGVSNSVRSKIRLDKVVKIILYRVDG